MRFSSVKNEKKVLNGSGESCFVSPQEFRKKIAGSIQWENVNLDFAKRIGKNGG
jgi:hypothetical protein